MLPSLDRFFGAHQQALNVQMGGHQYSVKGEDRFSMRHVHVGGEDLYFTMLADGHTGVEAAQQASQGIEDIATAVTSGSAKALDEVVSRYFSTVHERICSLGTAAGSTLTIACVNAMRSELSLWNVGDSLALLVNDEECTPLGTDHRLDHNPEEVARVTACGGTLCRSAGADGQPKGPLRALPGGLATARCIGDADCSKIVSCTPDHVVRPLPASGGVLLIGSRGMWERLSPRKVTEVIQV